MLSLRKLRINGKGNERESERSDVCEASGGRKQIPRRIMSRIYFQSRFLSRATRFYLEDWLNTLFLKHIQSSPVFTSTSFYKFPGISSSLILV